ncbi:MAG TPA: alpha/beta hydrolase [Thermoleophilaceae bacterium]|nr:alpha/beta hydrolase [Thermoleophilaceae bacterium]
MTSPATAREWVEGAVGRTLLRLPQSVQRLMVGRPTELDGLRLDPTSQLLLLLEKLSGTESTAASDPSPAQARALTRRQARAIAGRRIELPRVESLEIPGPAGSIPARLYGPEPGPDAGGLLVYLHGGGHVKGDLDTHDTTCRFLAQASGAGVLAVDYRLAPEHPFPAATEDAVAALRFASEQAERLGFDPARIAVGGDSAGGNLAAVAALAAKAGEAPMPAFQLLIYPVCDFSRKRRSYELFSDGFYLTEADMDWFRGHYLSDPEAASGWRASPILAPDHSGLPPAYVLTAGFDPLRDEGEEYAERLRTCGVPVALHRHDGLLHSFANQTAVHRGARDAMLEAAGALRLGLASR